MVARNIPVQSRVSCSNAAERQKRLNAVSEDMNKETVLRKRYVVRVAQRLFAVMVGAG